MPKRLPIAKQLERDAIHLLVTDGRFYSRVGHAIVPDLLPNEHARRIAELALAFMRETNAKDISLAVIAQRLRRLREQGRLTLEDTGETLDWLEGVLEDGAPARDAVVHELAEELKRHQQNEQIQAAMDAFAKHKPLTHVAEALLAAEKLGRTEETRGSAWDDDTDALSPASRNPERLPTGITDLDLALDGGLARGEFGFAVGNPGAGKSMFLSQAGASALQTKHNVFVVTLEVSEEKWGNRLRAAASNIPVSTLAVGELSPRDLEQLRGARKGQIAKIVEMSAHVAQVEDVWRAFDEANRELEQRGSPHRYDVLIVDYADKLGYPPSCKNNSYEGQRHVYESLRLGAVERNIWVWTASQSTRRDKKTVNALLHMHDVADSINKCRSADVVITLNVTQDRSQIRILLDKNRNGEAGFLSEYLQTDYAYGRIVAPTGEPMYTPPPPDALELRF